MVIQPALEPAFVHALPGADPDRRKLSRTATFAIAASVAFHVAVGLYIYEAKYGAPPVLIADDPITTFTPNVTIHDPPKPKPITPPPPRQLIVRASPTAPPTAEHTAPFTPIPTQHLDLGKDPPRLADVYIPPAPQPPAAAPSVITSPDWLTRPGPSEFSRFYPQAALNENASGAATLACTVSATGSVVGCQVASETPKGLGFGDAAKKLAPYFKMKPQLRDGTPADGASIRIPIRFNLA